MDDIEPKDLVPLTVLLACSINNHQSDSHLALMDSDSNAAFIVNRLCTALCSRFSVTEDSIVNK
jgi:hypothetical protein